MYMTWKEVKLEVISSTASRIAVISDRCFPPLSTAKPALESPSLQRCTPRYILVTHPEVLQFVPRGQTLVIPTIEPRGSSSGICHCIFGTIAHLLPCWLLPNNWQRVSSAHSIATTGSIGVLPCRRSFQLRHKDHIVHMITPLSFSGQ